MKVTKATARKDYPDAGIKKGTVYYSWAFFRGPTQRSLTYPRKSQITGSANLSAAYAVEEALEDALTSAACPDDVKQALDDAASAARDVISDIEETVSNLEDAFQGGCPALDTAQEQLEAMESYADELENAASEVEGLDASDYETKPNTEASFDNLTEDGQKEMLEAARDLAVCSLEI